MFVRSNKILFGLFAILSCASYCEAQFQWNFGCDHGACAAAPAYGMPPAGVHDVGGDWQWHANRDKQHRRAAGLYNQYCVRCHGVDGRGVWDVPDVPNFADPAWQSSRTDEQLARLTWEGRGAVMPAFRGTLTWDESWSLAHYIRELAYQKPSRPNRNQSSHRKIIPTPAAPRAVPAAPRSWQPVNPRPIMLPPQNPIPRFPKPSVPAPLIEAPIDPTPILSPKKPSTSNNFTPPKKSTAPSIKLTPSKDPMTPTELPPPKDAKAPSTELAPPENSTEPSKELSQPVTDELLDEYFKEKPARPAGPSDQPVEELPAPRQSSNRLNLPTYDLSAPILGNPTETIVESPSEIELRSYPAAIVSPWRPKDNSSGHAIPPYPYSAPPGPLPAVKRDFSSPLYRTR